MESRRQQREATTMSIWPPSPKAPYRDFSSERNSKSRKKSKRHRSPSVSSDSDDSEYERRRRERKEKKRSRKEKEKADKKYRSSRKKSYDSEEDDRDKQRKRTRTRSRSPIQSRSKTRSKSPSAEKPPQSDEEMEDDWMEKPTGTSMGPPALPIAKKAAPTTAIVEVDSDGEDFGPQPLHKPSTSRRVDERSYGGALLRGEGSAMAAFLEEDPEARIPRRGEIGLTSDEIAKYEDVGYVMSGSRHRRMNAVRMRKENQVISAEEKRGILKLQKEERERREAILREEFDTLVKERLAQEQQGKKPAHTG